MAGAVGSRSGWQDLDIATCIPEATGLISSHDNVPVMSTVRHCPLLPGESIFVRSRAESGNYATAFLEDRSLIARSLFSTFYCIIAFCLPLLRYQLVD